MVFAALLAMSTPMPWVAGCPGQKPLDRRRTLDWAPAGGLAGDVLQLIPVLSTKAYQEVSRHRGTLRRAFGKDDYASVVPS